MADNAGALALLLTPEEAARRLSLARSTLYELVLTGEIESFKIGRSRRIPADALTDFIERRKAQAQEEAKAEAERLRGKAQVASPSARATRGS